MNFYYETRAVVFREIEGNKKRKSEIYLKVEIYFLFEAICSELL